MAQPGYRCFSLLSGKDLHFHVAVHIDDTQHHIDEVEVRLLLLENSQAHEGYRPKFGSERTITGGEIFKRWQLG